MPVGKGGAQPASANAGKQSALPAGTEVAASESSTHNSHSAETNFQQAFSSALRDAKAPAAEKSKPTLSSGTPQPAKDTPAAQKTDTETKPGDAGGALSPVNGKQVLVSANRLLADILSPTPTSTIGGDSKAPASAAPLPAEQTKSKSKMAPQNEPADPKATQSSTDSTNAALISSVAADFTVKTPVPQVPIQAAVPNQPAAPAHQVPVSPTATVYDLPTPSVRDLPAAQIIGAQVGTAEQTAPAPPSVTQNAAPDSLSFALLLHPKLAQGPITTTQSVPVVKQSSDSGDNAPLKTPLTTAQATEAADTDSKIPVVAVPAGNSSGQAPQSDRSAAMIADPSQTHGLMQSAIASGPQQASNSPAMVFQAHSSQNSSSDQPVRAKTESASDDNSSAIAGLSDMAKPIINAANVIPNAPLAQSKTAETVSGTPLPAQVLNAQNQAPAQAAKEVVVRLQGQTGEAISVRLVDQGGQVQVAVRSSDPATANLLRQDLSSLTNNLDRAGWKPEVLASAAPIATSFVRETSSGSGSGHDGQNSQSQGQGPLDWTQQDSSRRRNTVADLWDEILTRQGT